MITRSLTIEGGAGPIELCIAEAGRSGRPLLAVHGFTGAKEDFTGWIEPLAELGWHVVIPDLRGHGESAKPCDESAYSLELFALDVLGLLDALGWPEVVVLGHSMGGMAVQTAVLRSPERFRAMVLMDTSHCAVRGTDPQVVELAVALAREEGIEAVMAAQAAFATQAPDAHQRALATIPGYGDFGNRKMRASSPAMYSAMLPIIAKSDSQVDRLDALRSLSMPTLVVVGEQDTPFLRPSQRMAAAIDQARLVVVPDAAHCPQFEAAEAWWSAVSGFLGGL